MGESGWAEGGMSVSGYRTQSQRPQQGTTAPINTDQYASITLANMDKELRLMEDIDGAPVYIPSVTLQPNRQHAMTADRT